MSARRAGDAIRPHVLAAIVPLTVEPALRAPYLSTLHWLREFWSWPDERREQWRRERLRAILSHAGRQVPLYRDLRPGGSGAEPSLNDFPIVTKRDMRGALDSHLAEGWESIAHVRKRTGGTSGEPFQYPLDRLAWAHIYAASLYEWEQTGYRYGQRVVMLGAPPSLHPESRSLAVRLRTRLENRVIAAAGVHVDRATSLERAITAERARGVLWYGYSGAVHAMADAVLRAGIEVRGPRAIVTTSENLQPGWRRRIEDTFGAPLFDQYGCNDGGVLAQTCRAGSYHIAGNVSWIEVLDGDRRPCPPGVEGDLVVTNLHNRTLPFIRYRVDDRVALAEGSCPCGRPGPRFSRIAGRAGDTIRLPDGRLVGAAACSHAFYDADKVVAYQFVQDDPARVRLRLEVLPEFDGSDWDAIQRALRRQFGPAIVIEHTTTEPLERTAGGKLPQLIRERR